MNLKETLAEKKASLAALKESVESGDIEATASAKALVQEIADIKERMAAAEEKAALLSAMNADEETNPIQEKETTMSIASAAVEAVKGVATDTKFSRSTEYVKAATDTITGVQLADVHKEVYPRVPERAPLASVMGSGSVSGNAVTYFVESADEGNFATVAENGKKPQMHLAYEGKTVALKKIAGFVKQTSEIIEDAEFLTSAIENKLLYKLGKKEDNVIMTDLLATTGLTAISGTNIADAIMDAKTNIATNTAYEADCIIISPADFQALCLAKDSNGQYYGGGYFTGAYGNGAYAPHASVWGLPVFVSSELSANTILVGAFKQATTVYRKPGVRVDISNSDQDDFIYNRVTLLAEERLVLAVEVPKAIAKITISAASE